MTTKPNFAILFALCASLFTVRAGEVARFEIREPLGQTWTGDWLTQPITVTPSDTLRLLGPDGVPVPAQFTAGNVLFLATIKANSTNVFTVVDDGVPVTWTPLRYDAGKVGNGIWELAFDATQPLPVPNGLPVKSVWPPGVEVAGVHDEWLERGPVRAVLRRTFLFKNTAHRYVITFDMRANDPWIGVVDEYALGKGTSIRVDLTELKADRVYHPYAYNARTFQPGGDTEDSTLEPPQHPIATLGPIWRDIWFNGGPFAFVYRTNAVVGIGFAAVRGSQWDAPEGVSLESQNLFVHGDKTEEARVWVELPTDAGKRHWALVIGQPELRKQMVGMIRRRADIPFDVVRKEWILEWPSSAPVLKGANTFGYLGGNFNEHQKNPTTIPRHVKRSLPARGPVKSRELAALAYLFTNPDYWPGPKYKWRIGNPNFHTDMYPTPFLIGLLMPDHPHARRWVDFGIENLKDQIDNDSFPGGSWKESISYSGAFFGIANYLDKAREAGFVNAFRDWPRIREIAQWFACMETPVDLRFGKRMQAPLGDTGFGSHVGALNELGESYRGVDARFSEQLRRFPAKWEDALDIGSRYFYGFGAALRGNAYDTHRESYVTIKAGPARNHYQGDELSFYFASLSTPLAIDYACHYSPRPWHAAMHNRPDMDDQRPVAIGVARAFVTNAVADVFVADERTTEINHVPLTPHETTRPGWEYPTTQLPADKPWTFRRYTMLVKHASDFPDYLVIRDEIESPQPVWWNLHVLARAIQRDNARFLFPGQLGVDTTLHVLTPDITDVQQRRWGWRGSMNDRRGKKGADYEAACFGAVIPQDFVPGTWKDGEQAEWLRLRGPAGRTEWLTVLMPNRHGEPAARVEKLSATSAKITLRDETELVHLGSAATHQAAVERGGKLTVLLPANTVKPWNELEFTPIPSELDRGGR